jgi:hypothetical protein
MGSFVFPNLLNVCGAHAAVALASGRTTRDPGAVGQKRLENVEKGRLAHPGTLSALSAIAPPSSACSCDRNSRVLRSSPSTVSTIAAPDAGHRLDVDCGLAPVLAERPHPMWTQIVALRASLDDAGPPISGWSLHAPATEPRAPRGMIKGGNPRKVWSALYRFRN